MNVKLARHTTKDRWANRYYQSNSSIGIGYTRGVVSSIYHTIDKCSNMARGSESVNTHMTDSETYTLAQTHSLLTLEQSGRLR